MQQSDLSLIEQIPAELLSKVFGYLPALDLIACACVSPYFNAVAHQIRLWIHLYEKASPFLSWLDSAMVHNIELSGVEERGITEVQNQNELYFRAKRIEHFFIQLHAATKLTKELSTCPRPEHLSNLDHQCAMLGPAIDHPTFSDAFFHCLLRWADIETFGRLLSDNVPNRGSINSSWAGLGLPLRLPTSDNGETFRLVIMHARNKATRTNLPYGGSRITGSSLLNIDPLDSSKVTLTPKAAQTVTESSSIVYTVDLGPMIESADPDQPSTSARWNEMRQELNAVISILSKHQRLVILGLQNTATAQNTPFGPFEVAKRLGGTIRSETTVQPLCVSHRNWRIWCTSADEVNATELVHIFSWLITQ